MEHMEDWSHTKVAEVKETGNLIEIVITDP